MGKLQISSNFVTFVFRNISFTFEIVNTGQYLTNLMFDEILSSTYGNTYGLS